MRKNLNSYTLNSYTLPAPGYGGYLKVEPFARQLSIITEGKVEAAWRRLRWDDQQSDGDELRVNEKKRVIYIKGKRYKYE